MTERTYEEQQRWREAWNDAKHEVGNLDELLDEMMDDELSLPSHHLVELLCLMRSLSRRCQRMRERADELAAVGALRDVLYAPVEDE